MHNALPTFFEAEGTVLDDPHLVGHRHPVLRAARVLVVRDRAIVIRELLPEVGALLHPQELQLVTTYFALGWKNLASLFAQGWASSRAAARSSSRSSSSRSSRTAAAAASAGRSST